MTQVTHIPTTTNSGQSYLINSDTDSILAVMEKLLHWAAIVESSDDAIISKSIDGTITSWNKGAQRLYGYTPEEIIGKPVSTLIPPSKKDDFPYIMKQLYEGKRVEHYETERMTKSGKIIHVSITVSPIKDTDGKIIGASKIARDITEKVDQAKRRDEFVSTASHELKTPITSQKAFGELLERIIDEKGYTELKRYIQKINQQTNKLSKLIDELLDLSRAEKARLYINKTDFKFDQFIKEVVENIQMTTKHKLIVKGTVKQLVYGDQERLGQVVSNLLTNAIKYSPRADKVLITVKKDKQNVILSIQDFGIGIDPSHHHKIFDRFYRVIDDNEKTFPGMGIGLYICKEILKLHEGSIWVESENGKGSTFSISLPLSKQKKK